MKWKIRQEAAGDEAAIAHVTKAAFAGKAYADGDEAELPGRLREAGALVLSLVAVERKQIIGHACLSPATVGDEKWLGLGPVSVVPDKQGPGDWLGLGVHGCERRAGLRKRRGRSDG